MTFVLDASALIAALNSEPGQEQVEAVLDDCVIGAVNVAEVASWLIYSGNSATQARAVLAALELRIVDADNELAIDAGLLRQHTDRAGLSLGDRFCLAVGRRMNAPILTADRSWLIVASDVGLHIDLIR